MEDKIITKRNGNGERARAQEREIYISPEHEINTLSIVPLIRKEAAISLV